MSATQVAVVVASVALTRLVVVRLLTSDAAAHPIAPRAHHRRTGAPPPPMAAAMAAASPSVALNAGRLSRFTAPRIAHHVTGAGR